MMTPATLEDVLDAVPLASSCSARSACQLFSCNRRLRSRLERLKVHFERPKSLLDGNEAYLENVALREERSLYFDDFRDMSWTWHGEVNEEDKKDVFMEAIPYFRLRLVKPPIPGNFGRGLTRYLPTAVRPSGFRCFMRLNKHGTEKIRKDAFVGYVILSDGDPSGPYSQGTFGAEAVFCFIKVSTDSATFAAVGDSRGARNIYETLATFNHDVRFGEWFDLAIDFTDWNTRSVSIAVNGRNRISMPFRGSASSIRQISLLSLDDPNARCSVDWTEIHLVT